MDVSTALLVILLATVLAIMIVLFGAMLTGEEPVRRAMLKSFAISVVGVFVLLRGQLFGGANTGGSPFATAVAVLICCGSGTVLGGTASALLIKGWKAWLNRAFTKP